MITINDVRDGVIAVLKSVYPDQKVHDEEIRQGLKSPTFFVKMLDADHTREVGRRYRRNHSFDVHYFADTNENRHLVAESLYDVLEYIPVNGGKVRGTSMKHEIVDNVLHFFVDYDFHVLRVTPDSPVMQHMEQEGSIKDG